MRVALLSAGFCLAQGVDTGPKSETTIAFTRLEAATAHPLKPPLLDRNWLDRMPETDRDRLYVYRFVPSMGGGVFQDRTLFKGTFELFTFETADNEIRFVLPETKERVTKV